MMAFWSTNSVFWRNLFKKHQPIDWSVLNVVPVKQIYRKLIPFYKPYVGLFCADLLCACLRAIATLALPLTANIVIKEILGHDSSPHILVKIYTVGAIMLGLVVLQLLCTMFVDYKGHMMGANIERDMRRDLFDHYQKMSFSYYDEHRTGQLMSRITHDLLSISELCHHGPEDILIALIKFTGVFCILVRINAPLTLIVLAFIPVMGLYAFYFNRRMNTALLHSKERIGDINAQVEDSLAGIRVVKSFANESLEKSRFADKNQSFLDSRREGYKNEAYFYSGMEAFAQLITITVIILGTVGITHASLGLPDLITYLLCVAILVDPVQRLVNFSHLYQEGITGFARFVQILAVKPDIQDAPHASELSDVQGQIEFRDLCFHYRENDRYVIEKCSFKIKAGEWIALVGPSGVGKTTLCSLIPRFYEPTAGEILIDGKNIKDLTLASLRGNIGMVQQDIYLFSGSVSENIRYGKASATDQEVIEAAKMANAHTFIMALPRGYETYIGQRGVKLSGGQKQRLSIARMFLKDAPILIFDEATSALDAESERAIQDSLRRLTVGRTTIVIAHRLSTVRHAHRILVLTERGIEEQGTHEELLARQSTYARLYNSKIG